MATLVAIWIILMVLVGIMNSASRKHKRNALLDHQYEQMKREREQQQLRGE